MKKIILTSALVLVSCTATQRTQVADLADKPVAVTADGQTVTVGDEVANTVGSAIGMATGNPIIGVAAIAAFGSLIGAFVKKYKTKA